MAVDKILLTILALPLIGALINGTLGKNLPRKVVGMIATGVMFISFGLTLSLFGSVHKQQLVQLFTMISLEDLQLNARLQLDSLSIWMTLIVTGVGSFIHLFSMGYMAHDKGYYKFFTYLNLFIFAMLILVLGSNYFMLFFGWEGVGICSYLLISFHYNDKEKGMLNGIAARKAFIMNRIGDLGLLIGLFLLLAQFGTLEYSELADKILVEKVEVSTWMIFGITMCLFIGATGKSAQIPLFTWLPDAMAGPTPVSALIHAATMVTAGIFLVVRSNFLFELAPTTQDVMLYLGLATSVVAAFIAMRQNDIKKVLAYSTVSQLGLLFVALGMGAYTAAMFHVTTHAFFKALLFLGSGSVIHAMHHEQDIRRMGGLKKFIPVTHITFLIGTLAIAGFPLLSGFYSKDEILAHAVMHNPVLYAILMCSVALTAIYMFRLYFLVFHGEFRGTEEQRHHLHESPANMTIPLIVLAVLSVVGGALNLPGVLLKSGTHWMSHYLEHNTRGLELIETHHLSSSQAMLLMGAAVVMTLVILLATFTVYVRKGSLALADEQLKGWQLVSNRKLYFDELYDKLFVKPTEWIAEKLHSLVELFALNKSIYGFVGLIDRSGELVRRWQSGIVSGYLFWMVLGVASLILYYLIKL
ncbi:MAG: NADH-quinone oxidoreductase subunit L [Bacteroidota bacterium]|jgi:NADH-quinone oxidoreductase subunit L